MKKRFLALLLAVCLLLAACTAAQPPATAAPTTAPPQTQPTTQPSAPTTQPLSSVYDGNLDHYAYRYESGRDRQWEEDVLYTAQVLLGEVFANGHPYLTDMEYQTFFALDGNGVEYATYFDAEMRRSFIQGINELLDQIPQLQDHEILFGLQRLVAQLKDLHTYIYPALETFYPLMCIPLYSEEQMQWYVSALPEKHSQLLFSRLVAINDVPVEEITQKLLPFISYENTYAAYAMMEQMLSCNEALSVIGVARWKEQNTCFLVEDEQGQQHTLTFAAGQSASLTGEHWYTLDSPINRNTDRLYWWEYIEEEKLMYVRFNHVEEDRDLVYSSFVKQLTNHMKDTPKTKKIVVDLRQNPGGLFHASLSIYLSSLLEKYPDRECYVLLDAGSYSAAIILSSSLRQLAPNVKLVGMPGGQPANFFASVHSYEMPESGTMFAMSDTYWISNREDTGDALQPDVVIFQTLEDLKAGKDTVMERIFRGDVE